MPGLTQYLEAASDTKNNLWPCFVTDIHQSGLIFISLHQSFCLEGSSTILSRFRSDTPSYLLAFGWVPFLLHIMQGEDGCLLVVLCCFSYCIVGRYIIQGLAQAGGLPAGLLCIFFHHSCSLSTWDEGSCKVIQADNTEPSPVHQNYSALHYQLLAKNSASCTSQEAGKKINLI